VDAHQVETAISSRFGCSRRRPVVFVLGIALRLLLRVQLPAVVLDMARSFAVVAFLLLAVTVAVAIGVAIAVIVVDETGAILACRGTVVDELGDQLVKGRELVVLANSCLVEVGKVCETSLLCEVDEQGNPCLSF